MTADLRLVQGDTRPSVTGTLKDTLTGTPIDLSDVDTVNFQMRKEDDHRYTVNAAADIVDASGGQVRYSWGANDLSNVGLFLAQWELHYDDATVQTTDPPNTIEVRRQ